MKNLKRMQEKLEVLQNDLNSMSDEIYNQQKEI